MASESAGSAKIRRIKVLKMFCCLDLRLELVYIKNIEKRLQNNIQENKTRKKG